MYGITKQKTVKKEIVYKTRDFEDGECFCVSAKVNNRSIADLYAKDLDSTNTLYISGLYVGIEYRNRGIAQKLNQELIKEAAGRNYKIMFCSTNDNNDIVKKILRNNGWLTITTIGNIIYYYRALNV